MHSRVPGLVIVATAAAALIAFAVSAIGQPSASALPTPILGKRVNVSPVSGKVSVRLPGKGQHFARLRNPRQVPVGTYVDTRGGKVDLVSARDRSGATQSGRFSRGLFKVRQSAKASDRGLTDLRLAGGASKSACAVKGNASNVRRALRKIRSRVRAGGHFRTYSSGVAATERGTVWDVTDDCGQIDTRVLSGEVLLQNFVHPLRRVVRAGHGTFRTKGRYSAATVRGG